MRTTIDIADPLLAEALRLAEREDDVAGPRRGGLRDVLKARKPGTPRFELKLVTFPGDGLREDVEEGSWERVTAGPSSSPVSPR